MLEGALNDKQLKADTFNIDDLCSCIESSAQATSIQANEGSPGLQELARIASHEVESPLPRAVTASYRNSLAIAT